MTPADTSLSLAKAEALAVRILTRAGAGQSAAGATARALVAAEADGQRGHGLMRLVHYASQLRSGKLHGRVTPVVESATTAAIRVDAGFGLAYPALEAARSVLLELVPRTGISLGSVRRSHHFGQAGYQVEQLAVSGCVALMFGNSPHAMAPWGGRRSLFGTNPLAFAAPLPGQPPLVVDLALSRVARGRIIAARDAGESIPPDWARGPDGEPTSDPEQALAGSMRPIADAKGSALALMIEVLAAGLTGSHFGWEASSLFEAEGAPPDLGQVLLVIDPKALAGDGFAARMAELIRVLEGEPGVRLPGSRRLVGRERARLHGLELSGTLYRQLMELAGETA